MWNKYSNNVNKNNYDSYNKNTLIPINNKQKDEEIIETIYIDSKDRNYTSYANANSFTTKIPDRLKNISSVELISLDICKAETNINSNNNKFHMGVIITANITAIDGAITASATTIEIDDSANIADNDYCLIYSASDPTDFSTYEVIQVDSGGSGTTLTVTRGVSVGDWTNPVAHSNNDKIVKISTNPTSITEITTGNYTYAQLITALTATHAQVTASGDFGKLILTMASGHDMILFVKGSDTTNINGISKNYNSNSIFKTLGFTTNTMDDNSLIKISASASYSVPGIADINGEPYVLLYIDELQRLTGTNDSIVDSFAKISLGSTSFGIFKLYKGGDFGNKTIKYFNPPRASIDRFTIKILKQDGNLYDLNGTDIIIGLEFKTKRKKF